MAAVASVEIEYRSAFEDFSRKAQRVQLLTEHLGSDRKAFETALLELEKAHLAYNEARDALVHSLLPKPDPRVQHRRQTHSGGDHWPEDRSSGEHRADVQAIAELLWESAGRPTGTAEEDWRRAEAIVKCAVEAASCGA